MRRYKAVLLAMCIIFFSASQAAQAISWEHDLTQALKEASGKGSPVMADFYTEWCGWCKKLDSDTYSDKSVNDLSGKFICVKVDADKSSELAGKYGVRGYPTIIFLNSKGDVVEKVVGYVDAEGLKKTMNKVLQLK